MSEIAQAAFEEYFSKFDPYGNEWQDRDASQIFVDGFDAGAAQLAALKEENADLRHAVGVSATCIDSLKARLADYEEVLADKRRLTRELDVLLNGEGAAKQSSLCDLVSQLGKYSGNPLLTRVAELERALALMLKVHDLSDSPEGDVTRIARAALKEPANEG